MNITENNIVGEIVAQDYRTASVFNASGIDFCCRGNRSLAEVCKTNNIETTKLLNELNLIHEDESNTTDYNSWPIDLLVDYIEKKHHRYVETKISEIKPYLNKIVRVHGAEHPELNEVEALFLDSAGELTKHMKKEELVLFPFVKKMVTTKDNGGELDIPHFKKVENPVEMMKEDHDNEGVRFRKIAELTQNYEPPSDACNTYTVTLALLKEFEADLHLHIHLENNILFPKALALEDELRSLKKTN